MKITLIISAIIFCIIIISFDKGIPSYEPLAFYNRSGRINKTIKIFTDTITPSTGNGYSLNISAAGFSSIISVNAIGQRNTATATSSPNIGVKSMTTSAIIFNMTEGNDNLINILGSNVLLGPATTFSNASGLLLHVTVVGY